jgi:hypothetical protein
LLFVKLISVQVVSVLDYAKVMTFKKMVARQNSVLEKKTQLLLDYDSTFSARTHTATHTGTHTHTQTHTHTRARARTHTHTYTTHTRSHYTRTQTETHYLSINESIKQSINQSINQSKFNISMKY